MSKNTILAKSSRCQWVKLSYTTKISHFAKGKLTCSGTEIPEYGLSRINKRSAADFGVERVHREYMTM